ncbi:MAG TPA: fibronectin type III domain-containing protein [Nocardioides sp.]|nr:fibronectin type III domain-containing protein [Nocardioides sp.]
MAHGVRGGRLTVSVHWRRPARTGGARVTGYRLTAYRLTHDRVVAHRTLRASSSRRSATLTLARGQWVVKVQAHNRVGWGPFSRRSTKVSPR